ncbi:MAG: hypothetical protein ACOX50_03845 [Patescibacteria group bacterium]|jgi:hypothetical protein
MIKKKKTPIPATSFPPIDIIRKQPSRSRANSREVDALIQYPQYYGEETIGGNMPNPEADDDSIESIQEWGVALDADDEGHSKEINLLKDIDQAERTRRRRRNTS